MEFGDLHLQLEGFDDHQESWAVQQDAALDRSLKALSGLALEDGSLRHCATNIVIGEGGLRDRRQTWIDVF